MPAAAVVIDFPDFHAFLTRRLKRDGGPLIYYVSPQVWAWRKWRARTIAGRARRIITLFPFEAEIYRRLGADAVCAGHPLVEDVQEGLQTPSPLPAKTRRRLVLMPGSRPIELERNWERMSEAACRLRKRFDLELVAVRAAALPETLFPGASERGIAVVATGVHAVLTSADLAFVASGTATLETALCGAPMVVVYRVSAVTWAIVSALVHLRWASLVNIVAAEEVVPSSSRDAYGGEPGAGRGRPARVARPARDDEGGPGARGGPARTTRRERPRGGVCTLALAP
jgi:lipid-A-disaccharide synthase